MYVGVPSNRRNFPRIPFDEPALLEFTPARFRKSKLASERQPRRITVMLASVACEGLRLQRPEPIDELVVGSRIKVRVFVDGSEVCLPGQVAWTVSNAGGETHVGVRLALEVADSASRQAWANWVVRQSERYAAAERARQSGNHSVVKIRASALRRAASNS